MGSRPTPMAVDGQDQTQHGQQQQLSGGFAVPPSQAPSTPGAAGTANQQSYGLGQAGPGSRAATPQQQQQQRQQSPAGGGGAGGYTYRSPFHPSTAMTPIPGAASSSTPRPVQSPLRQAPTTPLAQTPRALTPAQDGHARPLNGGSGDGEKHQYPAPGHGGLAAPGLTTPQKSSVTSSPSADAGTGMHNSAAASNAQTPQPQQVTADNGPSQ